MSTRKVLNWREMQGAGGDLAVGPLAKHRTRELRALVNETLTICADNHGVWESDILQRGRTARVSVARCEFIDRMKFHLGKSFSTAGLGRILHMDHTGVMWSLKRLRGRCAECRGYQKGAYMRCECRKDTAGTNLATRSTAREPANA